MNRLAIAFWRPSGRAEAQWKDSISRPASSHRHAQAGFTLVELLVVIAIMLVMIGIAYPFISKMIKITDGQSGQSSISVAANAVRILNQRLAENDLDTSSSPWGGSGDYSGTIALFTPQHEIRFCINDQLAQDKANSYYLEDITHYSNPPANGYKDIDSLEYLILPAHARVAGVVRLGSGTATYVAVFAPPFAMRFDEYGHLAMDQQYIYYDGDYDGRYDTAPRSPVTAPRRDSDYKPDNWDPSVTNIQKVDSDPSPSREVYKYAQPFEKIECVSSLILYDQRDFEVADPPLVWGSSTNQDIYNWLMTHGKPVFFSPHTGLVLKD